MPVLNVYFYSQGPFQAALGFPHVWIDSFGYGFWFIDLLFRIKKFGHQFFRLTNGKLFGENFFCGLLEMVRKSRQSHENLTVPKAERARFERLLDRWGQFHQTDEVGDAGTVLACSGGDLFLGKTEFSTQSLKGSRLLHGVEIFTLEVLNNRDLHGLFIGYLPDNRRNGRLSSALGGHPTPLAGDKLVAAVCSGSKDHRLNDARSFDGFHQFVQCLFPKLATGLVRIGVDQVDGNFQGGSRTTAGSGLAERLSREQ